MGDPTRSNYCAGEGECGHLVEARRKLRAEREAREKAEEAEAFTKGQSRGLTNDYNALLVESSRLRERAERAEEALREAREALIDVGRHISHGGPVTDSDRRTVVSSLEHTLASLSAVPAQRCPYNDPNCSCLEKDAPQPEEETMKCERLLVGQGDDTYDPLCQLPKGHEGTCSPSPGSGEKKEDDHAQHTRHAQPSSSVSEEGSVDVDPHTQQGEDSQHDEDRH